MPTKHNRVGTAVIAVVTALAVVATLSTIWAGDRTLLVEVRTRDERPWVPAPEVMFWTLCTSVVGVIDGNTYLARVGKDQFAGLAGRPDHGHLRVERTLFKAHRYTFIADDGAETALEETAHVSASCA